MSKTIQRCYLTLLCLLLPLGLQAAPRPKLPSKPDVRLIIDISGSMKQNDPHNLRQPAVRMVSRLLPDGSEAGVWTFGHQVNMLVPLGKVDKRWRQRAIRRSKKINSAGLYTNIGKALTVASDDFYKNRSFAHTHFILLTDGMVDLPGGAKKDAAERQRILTQVLQRIKSHGAHIDTIALSPDADRGLLKRLAVATGGISTLATSADQLSQAFLQALDNASPSEQVPISHNQFRVDKSIREFTALVFYKPGSQKTLLVRPDGSKVSADNKLPQVHWLHEQAYDLVTVDKPMPGKWHINAKLKPNSRVTVVSNFRMAVSDLPANFYPDDRLDLGVAFYDDKSQVTSKDFLRLITLSVTISDNHGRSGTKTLSDPGQVPDDGVYHEPITRLHEPGTYQVKVLADGKTFQREQTQTITLRAPVDVEVHGEGTGAGSRYVVTVRPQDPRLAIDKTQVALRYQTPDGKASVHQLQYDAQQGQWRKTLKATAGPGDYQVALRVKGMTDQDQPLQFAPESFTASFPRKAQAHPFVDLASAARKANAPKTSEPVATPVTSKPVTHSMAPIVKPEPAPVSTPVPTPTSAPVKAPAQALAPKTSASRSPAAPQPPQKSGHGMLWAGIIILALLLLGGAIGGFFLWRRRRGKSPQPDTSSAEAPEPEQPAADETDELAQLEEEPALDPLDDVEAESDAEADPETEAELPAEENEDAATMAGIDETVAEASAEGATEEDEAIPVMEESVPEPEAESASPGETPVEETPESDEALAEQVFAEINQQEKDAYPQEDDDYSLEDFDIGEVDDLPDESQVSSDEKDERDEKDDKGKA